MAVSCLLVGRGVVTLAQIVFASDAFCDDGSAWTGGARKLEHGDSMNHAAVPPFKGFGSWSMVMCQLSGCYRDFGP